MLPGIYLRPGVHLLQSLVYPQCINETGVYSKEAFIRGYMVTKVGEIFACSTSHIILNFREAQLQQKKGNKSAEPLRWLQSKSHTLYQWHHLKFIAYMTAHSLSHSQAFTASSIFDSFQNCKYKEGRSGCMSWHQQGWCTTNDLVARATRVRACNIVKFETGWNLPPTVTPTAHPA